MLSPSAKKVKSTAVAISISVACASNVATFAITGLTTDEIFTMSVSQDESSNWANLGAPPTPSQSMIIPMLMKFGDPSSWLFGHNIHYATF
jgi:hypothetical protein